MRKLLVAIGSLLLILLIVVPLAVWVFVDPDDLRARATAYVKEYTGYELTIAGPVTLSFFPWLGAEMRDVAIRQPGQTGGQPFATFEEFGVKVRVLPLLRRQVDVGGVTASGGLVRLAPTGGDAPASELRNVRLTSSGFGTADAGDLSVAFDAFDGATTVPVSLTSRMVFDLERDLLDLRDVTLTAADTTLRGRIEGRSVGTAPEWTIELKGDRLDLDQLGPLFAIPTAAPASPSAAADPAAPLVATIALDVDQFQASGLQLSQVSIRAESRDGVLVAKPLRGSLYGGEGEFTVTRDDRQREAVTRIAGGMKGVDLAPMLADLQQLQAFSGRGDVTLDLTVRGSDAERMRRSLSGQMSARVRDGRIEGADFVKMIVQAHAMAAQLRGRPAMASVAPDDATSFSTLAGETGLRNGVATIQELVIESPLFRATGDGTVNLAAETLDVTLRATSRETGDLVVPIAITGTFEAPRYSIQAGQMLKEAAKEELQRQLDRGLRRLLRKPQP